MFNKVEEEERLSELLIEVRKKADLSQEHIAQAMGVSRKTVQNWESGVSSPSFVAVKEWFYVCGVQEFKYLLRMAYHDIETTADEDDGLDRALLTIIQSMPVEEKKKLMFALYGDHGSSPLGILELVTAHLHTPLRDRINVALVVSSNYKLAKLRDCLISPDSVQPDIDTLDYAINQGMKAVVNGQDYYTAAVGEQEVSL